MALALGMTVGELGRRMSSRELTEWMAFDRLEPIGREPDRLQMAQLTAIIANAHRDSKKRPKPFEPEDFMPRWGAAPKEEQTWEEQARILEMWGRVLEATYGGGGS